MQQGFPTGRANQADVLRKIRLYCGCAVDTYSIWAYRTYRVRAGIRQDRALLEEWLQRRELQIPPLGPPDFLSRPVVLMTCMRFSLRRAAHVVVASSAK
jgi:hypothetical protein